MTRHAIYLTLLALWINHDTFCRQLQFMVPFVCRLRAHLHRLARTAHVTRIRYRTEYFVQPLQSRWSRFYEDQEAIVKASQERTEQGSSDSVPPTIYLLLPDRSYIGSLLFWPVFRRKLFQMVNRRSSFPRFPYLRILIHGSIPQ